jgi:TetR/AcrR family transcriptional repressor of nem operon
VVNPVDEGRTSRLTARGAATRGRIVRAAADLMFVKGVHATTLDEVCAASNTSKSQLYQHFADRSLLVREVVSLQARELLDRQEEQLGRLTSVRGLQRWRDAIVQRNTIHSGAYGCELGSLSSELADEDEDVRLTLAGYFASWEAMLAAGLSRMRDAGVLRSDADPARLATGIMAALQGGYVLAQAARDVAPMRIALDMAIDHVRIFAVAPTSGGGFDMD